MTDQTRPEVAAAASLPDAIDLSDLALIGIFSGPDSHRALIRHPGGRIEEVTLGTRIRAGQVVALSESAVTLARGGTENVLRMPEG